MITIFLATKLCKKKHFEILCHKGGLCKYGHIYIGSIIVANLKWISCFLTELRLLFTSIIIVNINFRNGRIISSNSIFNVSVYFLRDTLLRVKGLALTASRGSGFLHNLFYLLTSVSVEVLLSR